MSVMTPKTSPQDDAETSPKGSAVLDAALHPAAGEPHREASAVVVPTGVELALTVRGASELAAPDDECLIE